MTGALRRLGVLGRPLLAMCVLAAAAFAQSPHEGMARLPAGSGTLRGHVTRTSRGALIAGLDVVAYAVPENGTPGLSRATTDAEGFFQFDGVSNDPSTLYVIGVRAEGLPFGTRGHFAKGASVLELDLPISEITADATAARQGDVFLRLDRGCAALRVNEAHEFSNPSQRVIFVPADQRQGRAPLLRARLPAGASGFTMPMATLPESFDVDGDEVRWWGPLYPGSQEVEFSYGLPHADGSLSVERVFPDGARRVVVLTDEGGPRVTGAALRASQGRRIDGRPYRAAAAEKLAPGATLAFQIEVPPAGAAAVSLERAQIWLELDDAALAADEEIELRTPGTAPLTASSDAPLLCLELPPGSEGLRFSQEALDMGLTPDPSGALALRGPIPAGSSTLALTYRIPVAADRVVFARRYPAELPLLQLFVADTGVRAHSERLHRLRPVQTEDRAYLALEGFSIDAGAPVEVDLSRLAPRRPLSRIAAAGFALLAAGGAIAFLTAPLRGAREEAREEETAAARWRDEREALYGAIRDLDDDFELGKVSAEDRDELRSELRARAVQLMQRERDEKVATVAPPGPARCIACTAELPPQARFCPHCGTRQDAASA